jgi:F-type H+-transporting ATPase subunit a
VLVFLSVHWFGIRSQGLKDYLRHYLSPTPILLPFHVISEITRTLALAVRLFGNMMSLELVALLLVWVGGLLVPIPILMLQVVEALVQAYIFGMLALIYIASAIQTRPPQTEEPNDQGTPAAPEEDGRGRPGRFPHPGPLPAGEGDEERRRHVFHESHQE